MKYAVEVKDTPAGWAYSLLREDGQRFLPVGAVGYLFQRTARRAGEKQARRWERLDRTDAERDAIRDGWG